MNVFYFTITFTVSTILIIRIMSSTFSAYRRTRYQNQIAINNQQVIRDAQSKEKSLIKKIESFIKEKLTDTERDGITVDTVCERITAGDALVCAMFRKDPTKQSFWTKPPRSNGSRRISHLPYANFPRMGMVPSSFSTGLCAS